MTHTEPAALTTDDITIETNYPHVATVNLDLNGGILDQLVYNVAPTAIGAGAGTPIGIEVTLPIDACPVIELAGLIPDTEYELTIVTQSGVASSDPVTTTFTTRKMTSIIFVSIQKIAFIEEKK